MEATSRDRPPPSDGPDVRIVTWRPSGATETTDVGELHAIVKEPETRIWVDCIDPSAELVMPIAEALGLHPLIAEDIVERNQRAKVETFDDVVHIVLFALTFRGEVETAEIDLVVGRRFLVTVHGPECDLRSIGPLRAGAEPFLKRGTDYLLYALSDSIVDGYFPVLDKLADEIDDLQDQVFQSPSDWTLQRLFALKRELIAIRRATSPAREIFNQLTNREIAAVDADHVVYFRDVYDHLIRVTDELDNYRELVSGTLDIYLSTINNNLSRIMKRLTGVTVILAGIGALGGIFGMSEAGPAFAGGRRSSRPPPWPRSSSAGSTGSDGSDRLLADDGLRFRVGGRVVGRPDSPRLGEDLEQGRGAFRTFRRLEPEDLLGPRERVVEPDRPGDVWADLGDHVAEQLVVARVDLDTLAHQFLALVALRGIEEREEHPLPSMSVDVGRARDPGLDERAVVHRDVAWNTLGRALDDGNVDPEGRDHNPCRVASRNRCRRGARRR
jgi:magnesium transporter